MDQNGDRFLIKRLANAKAPDQISEHWQRVSLETNEHYLLN